MRYIKTYESTSIPKKGDWVWCEDSYETSASCIKYFSENIGQVINRTEFNPLRPGQCLVKFENIPPDLRWHFNEDSTRAMLDDEIILFDEDKDVLLAKIAARKYNL